MEEKHVRRNLGEVRDLAVHYRGTGNPEDEHQIIGVEFWVGTTHTVIGDCGQKTGVDKEV